MTDRDSPYRLPKPSLVAFNSTGKLAKKIDAAHERLSLPNYSQTPITPKSNRSKFVLPSTLSPFPFSPNSIQRKELNFTKRLSSSYQTSSTPLRHGVSSDQLVFDNDGDHSPSRYLVGNRSTSPFSSQSLCYSSTKISPLLLRQRV